MKGQNSNDQLMIVDSKILTELADAINRLEKIIIENNNKEVQGYMSSEETRLFLAISPGQLRKLVFRDEIPVHRIGRKLVFSKPELVSWVNAR